jgi:2-polyprenyl-3-methyl-5-hydroxy-6-metoxy-1,4-benzoquinol methylase
MARPQQVVLALVDISGYTKFLVSHRKAQEHAQMIIGALLESLMERAKPCLEISEVEGDALFLYAVNDSVTGADADAMKIARGQCLLEFFQAFSSTIGELASTAICRCPACANIDALRIKAIVHSGTAVISNVGRFTKLSGIDVIAAHRLLKNSVDADEYVLLTDAAKADIVLPDALRFEASEERYEDIGALRTHVATDLGEYAAAGAACARPTSNVGYEILRHEIRREYAEVASDPDKGFHFHTGRYLAQMLGYSDADIDSVPPRSLASFAGTGNPFSVGELRAGDHVIDMGCGAGFDTVIAARRVGPTGRVIAVDMTPEMVDTARRGAAEARMTNVEVHEGFAESLPADDGWADVIISNGVFNLCPNKPAVLREMHRVLKPGGRLQIGDILIQKALPESAKNDIDLWTG